MVRYGNVGLHQQSGSSTTGRIQASISLPILTDRREAAEHYGERVDTHALQDAFGNGQQRLCVHATRQQVERPQTHVYALSKNPCMCGADEGCYG